MNLNMAIPQEFSDYVTRLGNGLEVIPSVLYSTKDYTSATTRDLTFFDTTQGSRQDLTNMSQQNMLPNPESFLIQNIRIFAKSQVQSDDSGGAAAGALASQFNDLVQLFSFGVLNLKIGNKQYGPWPLWMLPANSFVKGAFSTGSDLLADYGQTDGILYYLEPNLCILPLQQFTVTLSWPAGAVTLSNTTMTLEVLFDGKLARSVQ